MTGKNNNNKEEETYVSANDATSLDIFLDMFQNTDMSIPEMVKTTEKFLFHKYIDSLKNPHEAYLKYREFADSIMAEEMFNSYGSHAEKNEGNEPFHFAYKDESNAGVRENFELQELKRKASLAEKSRKDIHDKNVDLEIEVFKLKEELKKYKNKNAEEEE